MIGTRCAFTHGICTHPMNTRTVLTIALVLSAGATAGILLSPARTRPTQPSRISERLDTEDPFADMIEEGDGLLAQRKAEAAAAVARARA